MRGLENVLGWLPLSEMVRDVPGFSAETTVSGADGLRKAEVRVRALRGTVPNTLPLLCQRA